MVNKEKNKRDILVLVAVCFVVFFGWSEVSKIQCQDATGVWFDC